MIPYRKPDSWIRYDASAVLAPLAAAKAAVLSLTTIPYQRSWAEELQHLQLKREVAGTSRIEGADFTERELDIALGESAGELATRSQRQAAAAVKTYRWIATLPTDRPVDERLIREIHKLIVRDADDDHCPPGELRGPDQNVTFGSPRHRGVEGGDSCREAFSELCSAIGQEFREHDPLVQALALHYHLAAMHPFLDGNGRTARAAETLLLQRTGLKDTLFIAMSNYYYEEKTAYLEALARVRSSQGDLTEFLRFGLRGIGFQSQRLFQDIRVHVSKALFKVTMYDLFDRLQSPRKRVLAERQVQILKLLLKKDRKWSEVYDRTREHYTSLKNPTRALDRDLSSLLHLRAIELSGEETDPVFSIRLDWPGEISETEFFARVKELPRAKTHRFL